MENLEADLRGPAERRAAAFSMLLDGCLDRSFRLAAVILGDREDAEDALSDAALRAWQHLSSLREPARFDAWFTRIVVNVCRDRLHRRSSDRRAQLPLGREPADAEDAIGDFIERAALRDALAALTPEHRAVVALHHLEGLTDEQVAGQLDLPVGTVKSRLHYAMHELRAAYDAALREPTGASGRRSEATR
jgi:RNA polymerase sigma-70 factor (ECF subfamily)